MQATRKSDLACWSVEGSGQHYDLRPFAGKACDLDVDFRFTAQPHLVTQIISNCLRFQDKDLSQDEVWSWVLKKRLQALLAITIATRGSALDLRVYCSEDQCGEQIELSLDLTLFQQKGLSVLKDEFVFKIEEKILNARLPTGWDQQHWLQQKDESLTTIAKKLVLKIDNEAPGEDWHFPSEWLSPFSEALEKHDELMTLHLNSSCPVCVLALKIELDLEQHLLTRLSHVQKKVLLDIHQLALFYHWTEKEILELSPQRRDFYLMQLEDVSSKGVLQ